MKTFFSLFFICLFAQSVVGQSKTTGTNHKAKGVNECVRRFNLTPEQRLREYPFNKATEIQLVSFSPKEDTTEYILTSVPINSDTLCLTRVKGLIKLNNSQVDKLTDILFNVGLKGNRYISSVSTAVGLDGGILFLNSEHKILEYINICFGCGDPKVETSKVRKSIGLPCVEKMDLLKSFFIESGLTYD